MMLVLVHVFCLMGQYTAIIALFVAIEMNTDTHLAPESIIFYESIEYWLSLPGVQVSVWIDLNT